jgi:hypothetical protein
MTDQFQDEIDFFESTVEFLVDQLHIELDLGNTGNAEALAAKIREYEEA